MKELVASAEQGDADAQYKLGSWFVKAKDAVEGAKWYRKAADQGNKGAQVLLGVCYHTGQGVKADYSEAAKWYRKAADQGDAKAQQMLGMCYEGGEGVTEHKVLALALYHLASKGGDKIAKRYRRDLEWKMTREQVAEAIELAHEIDAKIKSEQAKKK